MFNKRVKKPKIILPDVKDDTNINVCVKKPRIEKTEILFSVSDTVGLRSYGDGGATYDADPEHQTIDQALRQKEISKKIHSGDLDTELYRGLKGYALYAEKSDASIYASKYTGSLGPVKAPSHLRATCRFDYAYGLCKDWKVSGYCGYGDSCIFVHDRSEFKTGWELEKEWELEQEEKRKKAFKEIEEINAPEEPKVQETGCAVCNGKKEVTTKCKHEFCYQCSIKQFSKTSKCYVCGKDTKGLFNDIVIKNA
jgi:RING finger protein 113A